jgi:peptidoglycan/LPS O-acetylase OafA/YrhL
MKSSHFIDSDSIKWVQQPNAIDFVRYYLALIVILTHYAVLTGHDFSFINSSWEAVCGFFTYSGFLVFYSYYKHPSWKEYAIKRAKRILPPYFFIVLLCVIVGSIIGTLSFHEYWLDTRTYKYLSYNLSFLNFLSPSLPGVFENNTVQAVNGALWTMKVEVILYVSIPFVFYFMRKYKKAYIFAGIFLFACCYHYLCAYLYQKTNVAAFNILKSHLGWQFFYFYSGAFILCYFNSIMKYAYPLMLIALIGYYGLDFTYLNPLFFALFLLCFSYKAKCFFFLYRKPNFSYGLYLFHFPIIQGLISMGWHETHYYLTLGFALLLSFLLAIFSYYYIEKPFQ